MLDIMVTKPGMGEKKASIFERMLRMQMNGKVVVGSLRLCSGRKVWGVGNTFLRLYILQPKRIIVSPAAKNSIGYAYRE